MWQEKKGEGENTLQTKRQYQRSPSLKNKREAKHEQGVFLDRKFQLSLKAKEAFKQLKTAFTKTPLL